MIELSENLITGVDIVDSQHREIIKRTTNLIEACSNDNPSANIESILDYLADYVVAHFICEEKLQLQSGYPLFTAHKEQHDSFVKSFVDLRRDYMQYGSLPEMVSRITQTITDWLLIHIADSDVDFSKFYKKSVGTD